MVKEALHLSFSVITFVLLLIIALYHFISYFNYIKVQSISQKRLPSIYLSFLLILLAFIDLLSLLIETYDPIQTKTFCLILQHGGTISYALFKCVTYLTLITRLYESFNGSILQYNSRHLSYLSAILILWTFANIIIGLLFIDSIVDKAVIPVCVVSFPFFLPASWVFADLFAIICCSYLFCKPIFRLRKQMKAAQQAPENALYLKYIAVKQCALSAIACFTTILSLAVMGIFKVAPVAIGIDVNITIICVILMYKWNKYVIYWCCPQCKVIEDKTQIEETTTQALEGKEPVPSKTSRENQVSQV